MVLCHKYEHNEPSILTDYIKSNKAIPMLQRKQINTALIIFYFNIISD